MTERFGTVFDVAGVTDHELVISAYNGLLGPAYRQSAYIAVDAPVSDPKDDLEALAATLIRQDLIGASPAAGAPLAVPA